jgi:hypothetical protein
MSITYEGAIIGILAKTYSEVAKGTFDNIFTASAKDLKAGKTEEQWIKEIEEKLEVLHQEELKKDMFSNTQKEIAGDTYHKLLDWLEKDKGLPIIRDDKGVAIRLSGFEIKK